MADIGQGRQGIEPRFSAALQVGEDGPNPAGEGAKFVACQMHQFRHSP
jgi:hypothetical protein